MSKPGVVIVSPGVVVGCVVAFWYVPESVPFLPAIESGTVKHWLRGHCLMSCGSPVKFHGFTFTAWFSGGTVCEGMVSLSLGTLGAFEMPWTTTPTTVWLANSTVALMLGIWGVEMFSAGVLGLYGTEGIVTAGVEGPWTRGVPMGWTGCVVTGFVWLGSGHTGTPIVWPGVPGTLAPGTVAFSVGPCTP